MKRIKLLIADDHVIVREGIKLMLKRNSEFTIVAEANNGKEVIDYIANNRNTIDVVLMDINMPEMDGIETSEYITRNFKNVNILALSMHAEESYISSMLKAGALGYVLKEAEASELSAAIETVAVGKKYYSNDVSVTMINALLNEAEQEPSELSDREVEVIKHIANGSTNKEVGEMLCISARTIETHRRNILSKLDLKNTVEMIRYAIDKGIAV